MDTTHIFRDIDRRSSELEKEFALHRQATQYQINELSKRLDSLEKRKPAANIGDKMLEFILSPTVQKWAIGGGSGVGAWMLSRLMG